MPNKVLKFLKELLSFTSPQEAIKSVTRPPKKKKPSSKRKKKAVLKLRLDRIYFTHDSTIGELYINDEFECYTLEDEDKLKKGLVKQYGETAIPRGTFDVDISYSPRFKTKLPMLRDVPQFKGIRIHPGNTSKHTEGCILVGQTKSKDFIGRSRKAFKALFSKLEEARKQGKRITMKVV